MCERMLLLAVAAAGLAAVLGSAPLGADDRPAQSVTKRLYGTTRDGTAVEEFTLSNGSYLVKLITYGAAISEWIVPDRNGRPTDVILRFDDMDGWQSKGNPYFGCIVGRVANRIGQGRFTLDGKEYKLATNNGPNHLHGGLRGFDKVVWKAEVQAGQRLPTVRFSHLSPDGAEGYPGNLSCQVTYALSINGTLSIDYHATSDAATPVNLTNHAYFNLNGANSGSTVLNHELMIAAQRYTPTNDDLLPTGVIADVAGTPLDFTKPRKIGDRIRQITANPVGYDHNYVLNPENRILAARATVPTTGLILEMVTTEPGLQLYTGNFLDGQVKGKGGVAYPQYGGFCLEAQHFPDSVNRPEFPPIILRPGKAYRQATTYRISQR